MPQTTLLTSAQWLALTDPADKVAFLRPPVSERKLRLFGCYCCRRIWDSLSPEGHEALTVAERFAEGLASDDERQAAFRRLIETSGGYIGPHPVGRPWQTASLATDLFALTLALVIATNGETLLLAETGLTIGTTYEDMRQIHRVAQSCRTARRLAEEQAHYRQDAGRGTVGRMWNRLLRGVTGRIDSALRAGIDRKVREQEVEYQAALVSDIFGNPFRPVDFSPDWRTDTALTLARQMYESGEFSALPILADALQDAGCDNEPLLAHCRNGGATHVRGCWVVDLVLGKS
jgi:hypothetical protein